MYLSPHPGEDDGCSNLEDIYLGNSGSYPLWYLHTYKSLTHSSPRLLHTRRIFSQTLTWASSPSGLQAQPASVSAAVSQHHAALLPHPLPQQLLQQPRQPLRGGGALPAPPAGRTPPHRPLRCTCHRPHCLMSCISHQPCLSNTTYLIDHIWFKWICYEMFDSPLFIQARPVWVWMNSGGAWLNWTQTSFWEPCLVRKDQI